MTRICGWIKEPVTARMLLQEATNAILINTLEVLVPVPGVAGQVTISFAVYFLTAGKLNCG